jgi:hypothetical protein
VRAPSASSSIDYWESDTQPRRAATWVSHRHHYLLDEEEHGLLLPGSPRLQSQGCGMSIDRRYETVVVDDAAMMTSEHRPEQARSVIASNRGNQVRWLLWGFTKLVGRMRTILKLGKVKIPQNARATRVRSRPVRRDWTPCPTLGAVWPPIRSST